MVQEIWEIVFMFLKAFAVGGAICTIAQIIINITDITAGKNFVYFFFVGGGGGYALEGGRRRAGYKTRDGYRVGADGVWRGF